MNFSNIKEFTSRHAELLTVLLLLFCCIVLFFVNIGIYALMDVDETRYVSMAREMFESKDFLTLYLDKEFFFEKPPLYFWGECLSFALFGKINEMTARFPVALYGMLSTFLVYFVGRKIVSRNYGLIAALIMATSLEFIILSKFAILDIVVSACIGFSTLFGFMTFFCKEKNKKYFWWLFYIFSGLAVMAKGIPGFIVPFGIMFFASIFTKRFKEIFKPQYFIVGTLLFLLIVLPWHIIMLKLHGQLFWNEYFIKHHWQRFVSSEEINRAEPFYFYIVTFLWGFFPWTVSALAVGIAKIKELFKNKIQKIKPFDEMDNSQKFMYLNIIGFLFTFIFFSASSTKLITYILPVYFFSACIFAFVWKDYIEKEKYKKPIDISVYILGIFVLIAAIAGMLTVVYLPAQLYQDILHTKWLCVGGLLVFGIWSLWSVIKNKRILIFAAYIAFIGFASAFLTEDFFEIDYKFGQDDLMRYAKFAKEQNADLTSFGFSKRYSLLFYYSTVVEFEKELDYEYLNNELKSKNTYIIIKNKDTEKIDQNVDFNIIEKGRKYSLIKGIQ